MNHDRVIMQIRFIFRLKCCCVFTQAPSQPHCICLPHRPQPTAPGAPNFALTPFLTQCPQASADGPLVIKFLMEGMPGESTASLKVEFRSMFKRGGADAW